MRRRGDSAKLLRWYPQPWRERYGDEFLVFLEDCAADGELTRRSRASIAFAGLRERGRVAGLTGDRSAPRDRARAGVLLVLCAWAVYVVAGVNFAKYTEQFSRTVPAVSRSLPWGAFRAVQILAVVATAVVVLGATVAAPAFLRFVQAGGWSIVRRRVQRAAVATVLALTSGTGLVAWANSLTFGQRNGGDPRYGVAVVVWALVLVTTLALWTAAAIAVGRRLTLTRAVLATEATLAGILTTAMVAMTAAVGIWWVAMAADAPWFFHGTRRGTPGSAFDPRLAVTMALMIVAVAAAAYGTTRAARSLRRLPA